MAFGANGQRSKGPKPAAAFGVVPGNVEHLRPEPPDYLNEAEAEVWQGIVARMPVEWFTIETWPLLAGYCQHIVIVQDIMEIIHNNKITVVKMADKESIRTLRSHSALRNMLGREHRAMANLATKLRLTPQSKHEPRKQKKAIDEANTFARGPTAVEMDDSAA
jgi:phage terminase small subunit